MPFGIRMAFGVLGCPFAGPSSDRPLCQFYRSFVTKEVGLAFAKDALLGAISCCIQLLHALMQELQQPPKSTLCSKTTYVT